MKGRGKLVIDLGDGRMMNTNGNVRIVLELKKTKTGWFVVTSPFQREGNETRFPKKNLIFLNPAPYIGKRWS